MNPNHLGEGLTLNISEHSNEQDISLVMATAKHYQVEQVQATKILSTMKEKIADWRLVAKKYGINNQEIEQMRRAFRLVG